MGRVKIMKLYGTPNGVMKKFIGFSSKKRVYFKFLYKVDDRFKCINIWFNMHFVESSGQSVQNYSEGNSLEDFVKIFFKQVKP